MKAVRDIIKQTQAIMFWFLADDEALQLPPLPETPQQCGQYSNFRTGTLVYNKKMETAQICPVCGDSIAPNNRYPVYVCKKDVARATDRSGNPVRLSNQDMGGGFMARYADGSEAAEVSRTHIIYIDGTQFYADEAYMGGVVVTPQPGFRG